MVDKWQPDWDAYIRYNIEDATLSDRIQKIFYEKCQKWRRELLPRFGSAWENMMYYYLNRPKEAQNAKIR